MSTVMVIPDLHIPFVHKNFLPFCRRIKKNYKPDMVVCLGDLVDLYAFSRYDKAVETKGAGEELRDAQEQLKPWFKLFPRVKACYGNHDVRLYKKAGEAGLPTMTMKPFGELLGCPEGWEWSDRHEIEGVQYIHGDGFSGRHAHINAAERHRQSTVMGHAHFHAGIVFLKSNRDTIFGMGVGCGIESDTYAFQYSKHHPFQPILAIGLVRDGKYPQLIPMES